MKRLNLFENFDTIDKKFKEIDVPELSDDNRFIINSINIEDKYKNKLIELGEELPKVKIAYGNSYNITRSEVSPIYNVSISKIDNVKHLHFAINDKKYVMTARLFQDYDEYFYIYTSNKKMWKCDQWDGVIDCLKFILKQ